jgi:hypothetical protein
MAMNYNFEKEFNAFIRGIVREEVAARTEPPPIDLISIKETAALCSVGRDVIDDLARDAAANGFPAVRLGERNVRIDRTRLRSWLASGGLDAVKVEDHDNVTAFRKAS